jgi:hypothetical protein
LGFRPNEERDVHLPQRPKKGTCWLFSGCFFLLVFLITFLGVSRQGEFKVQKHKMFSVFVSAASSIPFACVIFVFMPIAYNYNTHRASRALRPR